MPDLPNVRLGGLLAAVLLAASVSGADLFVDNVAGRDSNTGRVREPADGTHGPYLSIRRALRAVKPGDTLTIVNTGQPYYESLELVGPRFSGTPVYPFTIDGGGAVISGARRIPAEAWQYAGDDLWRFRPFRKGWYQLLLEDAPLPEVRIPRDAAAIPELTPGQWCAWQGQVWYRAKVGDGETPLDLPLTFAYDSVGISLINVRHVILRDLTIRHFRQDGVNAHDRADTVVLERVHLVQNGRAGLSVSGHSLVGVRDSKIFGNRDAQLINAEIAQTEVENCDFQGIPHPFSLRGGHLVLDGQEVTQE